MVLGARMPTWLPSMYSSFDELYLIADLIVQNYFLLKYKASFSEKFYDLERCDGTARARLSPHQHLLSLLFLVVVPYIKEKLDALYEHLSHLSSVSASSLQTGRGKWFVHIYPYLHSSWQSLTLLYHVTYTLGWSATHTPLLALAHLTLRARDLSDDRQLGRVSSFADQKTVMQKLHYVTRRTTNMAAVVLSNSLSVGVFFLQFLQWWYSQDNVRKSVSAYPIPKPPDTNVQLPEGITNKHCPLCKRIRTNHTALLVSGYVFCYPCIYRYISQNGRCPVTQYPTNTDHVVKIYIPDT